MGLIDWIIDFVPKNQKMRHRHKDPKLSLIIGLSIGIFIGIIILIVGLIIF